MGYSDVKGKVTENRSFIIEKIEKEKIWLIMPTILKVKMYDSVNSEISNKILLLITM